MAPGGIRPYHLLAISIPTITVIFLTFFYFRKKKLLRDHPEKHHRNQSTTTVVNDNNKSNIDNERQEPILKEDTTFSTEDNNQREYSQVVDAIKKAARDLETAAPIEEIINESEYEIPRTMIKMSDKQDASDNCSIDDCQINDQILSPAITDYSSTSNTSITDSTTDCIAKDQPAGINTAVVCKTEGNYNSYNGDYDGNSNSNVRRRQQQQRRQINRKNDKVDMVKSTDEVIVTKTYSQADTCAPSCSSSKDNDSSENGSRYKNNSNNSRSGLKIDQTTFIVAYSDDKNNNSSQPIDADNKSFIHIKNTIDNNQNATDNNVANDENHRNNKNEDKPIAVIVNGAVDNRDTDMKKKTCYGGKKTRRLKDNEFDIIDRIDDNNISKKDYRSVCTIKKCNLRDNIVDGNDTPTMIGSKSSPDKKKDHCAFKKEDVHKVDVRDNNNNKSKTVFPLDNDNSSNKKKTNNKASTPTKKNQESVEKRLENKKLENKTRTSSTIKDDVVELSNKEGRDDNVKKNKPFVDNFQSSSSDNRQQWKNSKKSPVNKSNVNEETSKRFTTTTTTTTPIGDTNATTNHTKINGKSKVNSRTDFTTVLNTSIVPSNNYEDKVVAIDGAGDKIVSNKPSTITSSSNNNNNNFATHNAVKYDFSKDEDAVLKDSTLLSITNKDCDISNANERDSANHSPMSGIFDVHNNHHHNNNQHLFDVRSEGSTDSGKGCSDGAVTPTPTNGGSVSDEHGLSIFQFIMPQTHVGKLIGKRGQFINYVKASSNTCVYIKTHPFSMSKKVCAIEGSQHDIAAALDLIRARFPKEQYPDITLEEFPIVPLVEAHELNFESCQQLELIEGVNNDVIVCSLITAGHFFLHQPTHPTYQQLMSLNIVMNDNYNNTQTPAVIKPTVDMIVAAPSLDGWYRAQVVSIDESADLCDVRFLDYGGYSTLNFSSLRAIRYDFLNLPFQAVECFLANVTAAGDTWSEEAKAFVESLTFGSVLRAQVCDYTETGLPLILLYVIFDQQVILINHELIARGFALAVTPVVPVVSWTSDNDENAKLSEKLQENCNSKK